MREPPAGQHRPFWKKLGWLILIWAASIGALGLVALLIRLLMNAAGMTA
ncbi:MAG: hypothetical protein JWQ23_4260 [Herminiimonas sp.]|nr:hypothetical protein [Herminiimonas sp.]